MNIKGTIYFLLFMIFVALSGVYQGHLSQTMSPIVFIFFSSIIATITFCVLSYKNNKFNFIKKSVHNKKNLFLLNIAHVMAWFGYLFGIKYLEPAIGVIISNASGPILVIIISKILRPHIRIFRLEKIAAMGITISLIFIIYSTFVGKSAVGVLNSHNTLIGLSCAIIGGIGQVLFSIYSKKLCENNFLPNEILAWRFLLMFAISIVVIDKNMIMQLLTSTSTIATMLFLTIFGLIIPMYFYQKGVKLIEPIYISVLYILEPIIMFIGQIFDPRLKISMTSYAGVFFICLFSILSISGRYFGLKRSSQNYLEKTKIEF